MGVGGWSRGSGRTVLGSVQNFGHVNKFGRTSNCDMDVPTDIHDQANAVDNVPIWLAPTAARNHSIVSSNAADAAAGVGARSVELYGLTSWTAREVSETVVPTGVTPVSTVNDYVIIHRMLCTDWGTSGPNVGILTATAASDGTITAQINAGVGQTQMAVYGIPANVMVHVSEYYLSALRASSTAKLDLSLLVNPIPDRISTGFLTKHTQSMSTAAASYLLHEFDPWKQFEGPAIIKLQVTSNANDAQASGGFDAVLEAV